MPCPGRHHCEYSLNPNLKTITAIIKADTTEKWKPQRDNDMIEPKLKAKNRSFIDNSQSLWLVVLFCVAYSLLTRLNQVETAVQSLQFLAFSLGSIMSLSRWDFHFCVVSALQLLSLYFYFWLIRPVASSYERLQHYRCGPLLSVFTSKFDADFAIVKSFS